jgi:hypothetical protein
MEFLIRQNAVRTKIVPLAVACNEPRPVDLFATTLSTCEACRTLQLQGIENTKRELKRFAARAATRGLHQIL